MATEQKSVFPAYVTYATFVNFLDSLKASGTPHRIDKSVMRNLSGGVQGHLISTMKFLGLIGDQGHTLDALKPLADSRDTDAWPSLYGEVVKNAYAPIIGDLNLATATPALLREAFKGNSPLDGATLDKALRFFLQAVKDAQIPTSAHLANWRVPTTPAKRSSRPNIVEGTNPKPEPPKPAATTEKHQETPEDRREQRKGTISYPLYFRRRGDNGTNTYVKGELVLPDDLTEADLPVIEKQLEVIRAVECSGP